MFFPHVRSSLWEPLNEIERLRRSLNAALSGSRQEPSLLAEFPAVNVWTSDEGAFITAEVPGVDCGDLEASVINQTLTITGRRQPIEVADGGRLHRQERWEGEFSRSLELPFRVDPAGLEATISKGVLRIKAPRAAEEKPRKIKVKSA